MLDSTSCQVGDVGGGRHPGRYALGNDRRPPDVRVGSSCAALIAIRNIVIAKSSFAVITTSAKVHPSQRQPRLNDPRIKAFERVVPKNNNTDFPVIDIEHISKYYVVDGRDIPAITDINLRVEQGEIFGIIGASGAGKSTLIRTLNLLERPDSGRILVDGSDITKLSKIELQAYRRKAGMIFQHFNLIGAKTVGDNIRAAVAVAAVSVVLLSSGDVLSCMMPDRSSPTFTPVCP